MFEEYPLPQIPKDTPSLGWRHSGAACAVLEFQSGNAILAQVQGIRPDLSGESTQQIEHNISSRMHAADPEEQLPLLYQVPLRRLVNWTKWWHIVARVVLRAFQRRYWGLLGHHLQTVTGVVNPHLAQVRLQYGRGRGRLLPQLSQQAPK